MSESTKLCEKVGSGWIFPLSTFEVDLHDGLRAAIYAVMLIYFFFGIAIISDIFMSSIDMITSRRKKMIAWHAREPHAYTPKVWNDTVATLSLMALGSSAPEIFLSMVEIFKKKFHIGPLGTSTIVGSAAFNLLVIIAVCMVVIPKGEGRLIKDLPAFYITAVFSLFAYLWLAFIIELNSPNVVELWEAILTLLFLPLLILISWWADVGGYGTCAARLGLPGAEEEEEEDMETPSNLIKFRNQEGSMNGQYFVRQTAGTDTQHLDIFIEYHGNKSATVNFRSETFTAVPAYHYEDIAGTVHFHAGDHVKCIHLPIRPVTTEIERDIAIILSDPEGAEFDPAGNGGEDESILLVTIQPVDSEDQQPGRTSVSSLDSQSDVKKKTKTFTEKYIGSTSGLLHVFDQWRDQFIEAIYCGGSREEQKESSWFDFIMHLVVMPWKVLFCTAPPLYMSHGWARFVWSLFGIGCVTMVVSDLAELFGCVMDISDICTALIFVALGTSMPDLFASLSAAKEDPTADAAIVNVTGSNSVNVFLGVGLPYTIAAIYWEITGETFVLHSEGLSYSIVSFCVICLGALVMLWGRRKLVGHELGGPQAPKFFSGITFLCFWIAFVAISSWRVAESSITTTDAFMAMIAFVAAVVILVFLNFVVLFVCRVAPKDEDEAAAPKADEESLEKAIEPPSKPTLKKSMSGISNHTDKSDISMRSNGSLGRKRAPVLSFGSKKKKEHHHHHQRDSSPAPEPKSPKSPTLLTRSASGLSKQSKQGAESDKDPFEQHEGEEVQV